MAKYYDCVSEVKLGYVDARNGLGGLQSSTNATNYASLMHGAKIDHTSIAGVVGKFNPRITPDLILKASQGVDESRELIAGVDKYQEKPDDIVAEPRPAVDFLSHMVSSSGSQNMSRNEDAGLFVMAEQEISFGLGACEQGASGCQVACHCGGESRSSGAGQEQWNMPEREATRFRPSSSASYHPLRCASDLTERDDLRGSMSWRKRRSLVPVVTGKEREVFLVDPHLLEHWLFQDLLQKDHEEAMYEWMGAGKRRQDQGLPRPISLKCDSILFEFFLWLIENDDPSLRDLNLGDLMEFYGSES
ncbi:hypothetical protein L7F22_030503 [Adiantum nelumboides]|nr:hypothetical protein [Adiantum nelumboides]